MKTQLISHGPLSSSRLVYGTASIAGPWDKPVTAERRATGQAAIHAAVDAGFNHIDTADIYCFGASESIIGETLRQSPALRDRLILTTKCGVRFPGDGGPKATYRYDFSASHILASCDGSLKRLGTDHVDLYLLHRPDVLMNPPEVAQAFDQLQRAGKVLHFGVSNFSPTQLAMLQTHLPMPLVAHQIEIHPARLDPFTDGTLDQCIGRAITPMAWSSLGRGMFGDGAFVDPKNPRHDLLSKLVALIDEIAAALGTNRSTLALAWLLKHPSGILPIIGTTQHQRIRDAAKADGVELSREDWYRIYIAARGQALP
jgi:predicted oxidoreductase